MKLNATQIERTLTQVDAEAIPPEHPVVPQLERMFGDHTYFLDGSGLSIVELLETEEGDGRLGVVVNLANWTDASAAKLQPHEPEATDQVIDLDSPPPLTTGRPRPAADPVERSAEAPIACRR